MSANIPFRSSSCFVKKIVSSTPIAFQSMLNGLLVYCVLDLSLNIRFARCLGLIKEHSIREEVLAQLYEAGLAAWTRGAHEVCATIFLDIRTNTSHSPKLSLETLENAQFLLTEEDRINNYSRTFSLYLKLAE